MLSHFNDFSQHCYTEISGDMARNTRVLKSIKSDLDYIFLKLRYSFLISSACDHFIFLFNFIFICFGEPSSLDICVCVRQSMHFIKNQSDIILGTSCEHCRLCYTMNYIEMLIIGSTCLFILCLRT